ncbi:serine protease [Streptomyces sp. NPDC046716]|uniref:serine protease n=1 Tax=Streptomyces sp. NPDC046716 TaxID=3157093 RepID=UPI0033E2C197
MVDPPLVRISDLAGRPRGAGFAADDRGTVVTSHEAVAGLGRVVLHAPDGSGSCVVGPEAVVELPEADLALVTTEGLAVTPVPVAAEGTPAAGAYVRIPAGGWREARVLGHAEATYTATGRCHVLADALELAVGTAGADALRPGCGAAGGPVLDAGTGAVVAVLGTALDAGHPAAGCAVPLRAAAAADPGGPLADLLARNAATVPAYGPDLNLAGVLQVAAVSVAGDGPGPGGPPEPVERPDVVRELAEFERGDAAVVALVGDPGSGRTTELAALAARRTGAPTFWLRGADLRGDDACVADAVLRALERAGRIVGASREDGAPGELPPERVAAVAHAAGRPLVLLLDGPEEMPPVLAHRLAAWSRGTERWLTRCGVRLVVACREEYWEQAGTLFGAEVLHGAEAGRLPRCVRLGDLTGEPARLARERYGIPRGALADRDAGHPLALRLLGEVRSAVPEGGPAGRPDRDEVFSAHLDLMCLRVAVRLAAPAGVRGSGVRRLAARVSGRLHEAARRSLGPGQGDLDRGTFEELFPWGVLHGVAGWASAVLAEGVLVPAGAGYRFAHEEVADWIQGMHLDLDAALTALVFRRPGGEGSVPVPRHRAGPVVRALLLVGRERGAGELGLRLRELAGRLVAEDAPADRAEASWWAAHLLGAVLLRVPDAAVHLPVLEELAERGVFGPGFWRALPVADEVRFELVRRLVVHDPEPGAGDRYLDAVAARLRVEPAWVRRQLTRWFDDDRVLPALPDATVATAAQALLYAHRHPDVDDLTEALVDCGHPRADELLGVLADEEASAVCRAVERWARDERGGRRVAAAVYGVRVAPRVAGGGDRELLRRAALALLARPADSALHGAALALLLRDPAPKLPSGDDPPSPAARWGFSRSSPRP